MKLSTISLPLLLTAVACGGPDDHRSTSSSFTGSGSGSGSGSGYGSGTTSGGGSSGDGCSTGSGSGSGYYTQASMTLDQCPLGDDYVNLFSDETTLRVTATLTSEQCGLSIVAQRGILGGGAGSSVSKDCSGKTCSLTFTLTRPTGDAVFSDHVVQVVGYTASDTHHKRLTIKGNPKRKLYVFPGHPGKGAGAASGDADPLVGVESLIPEDYDVVELTHDDTTAHQQIKTWLETELTGSTPSCRRYPNAAMLGFSNGGHASLYNLKQIAAADLSVYSIHTVDPVPWGSCSMFPLSDPSVCAFNATRCADHSKNYYQQVHVNPGIQPNWVGRGRTVGGGGTVIGRAQTGLPCDNASWPDGAHEALRCAQPFETDLIQRLRNMPITRADNSCDEGTYDVATCRRGFLGRCVRSPGDR